MSQMNPKEAFHNTIYSVQLSYIAGHSFKKCKTQNIYNLDFTQFKRRKNYDVANKSKHDDIVHAYFLTFRMQSQNCIVDNRKKQQTFYIYGVTLS